MIDSINASVCIALQTSLISIDNLLRVVNQSQLTEEFDGTLPYDHNEWIEIRMVRVKIDVLSWKYGASSDS